MHAQISKFFSNEDACEQNFKTEWRTVYFFKELTIGQYLVPVLVHAHTIVW